MRKPLTNPRDRLATNLKVLIASGSVSVPDLAEKAKVDRKTINNLLNKRFDPRLSLVEKVANALGYTTWQLLATDLEASKLDSKQIVRLIDDYSKAQDTGRAAIMQVADIAAQGAK